MTLFNICLEIVLMKQFAKEGRNVRTIYTYRVLEGNVSVRVQYWGVAPAWPIASGLEALYALPYGRVREVFQAEPHTVPSHGPGEVSHR